MLPLIILALSLAVPALTRPAAGIAQRFLCERSYLNFAWGYQHFGIYVDRDGDVYRFRIGPGGYRKHPSGPTLTEKELDDKYGDKRTRVRTLSADEVRAMLALIPAAAKGQFSTKVSRSRDAGSWSSACYLFDPSNQTYREIELDVEGDWTYRNLAPEAAQLHAWLSALAQNEKAAEAARE